MSKNTNKISINKFETALEKDNIVTEVLSGADDVTMQIKKRIPFSDMISFVQEVVESCVSIDETEYVPEAYDLAIRTAVLTRYANFTMPSNIEKQYWLVYNTSAYDQVMKHIDLIQFNDIIRTIDRKISYRIDVMSSSAAMKINEVANKFGELLEISSGLFGDTTDEEMSTIVKNLSKLKDAEQVDVAKAILDSKRVIEVETNNEEK